MAQHGDDLVRHVVDIPEVHLERVGEHLAHARLAADEDRHAVAERLERRDAERLAHARHHVEVGHAEDARDVLAAQEPGEEHLVPDAELGGKLDHRLRLVAAAGHHELDVLVLLQDALGGVHEVLRALLQRDAAEVEDDLVAPADGADAHGLGVEVDAVVDHFALGNRHGVAVGADVPGQHADRDHLDGGVHAAALDVVDGLVDVLAGTVEFRAVDMHHERLAGDARERDAGGVGEPVVRVDHVEIAVAAAFHHEARVGLALREEVARVVRHAGAARERHACAAAVGFGHRGADGAHHLHHLGHGGRIVGAVALPCFQDAERFLACGVVEPGEELGADVVGADGARECTRAEEPLRRRARERDALEHGACAGRCVGAACNEGRGNHPDGAPERALSVNTAGIRGGADVRARLGQRLSGGSGSAHGGGGGGQRASGCGHGFGRAAPCGNAAVRGPTVDGQGSRHRLRAARRHLQLVGCASRHHQINVRRVVALHSLGEHEGDVHVHGRQGLGQPVACRAESAGDERRELPAEHHDLRPRGGHSALLPCMSPSCENAASKASR